MPENLDFSQVSRGPGEKVKKAALGNGSGKQGHKRFPRRANEV